MSHERLADYQLLPVPIRCRLGEGPWWSVAQQRLLWVDILGRQVHSVALHGDRHQLVDTPTEVGFAILDDNEDLVLGLRDGLFRRNSNGEVQQIAVADYDTRTHRINDGGTDRSGRLWYGTMHDLETDTSGHLYRFTPDEGARRQHGGVTVSNGLGWSPDNSLLYYADSGVGVVTVFDYDAAQGTIERPRAFATWPVPGQSPDGLTIDRDGCLWAAVWDGGVVVQFDPDGSVMQKLRLPVSKPTSCAFVGENLSILAVTSATPTNPRTEPLAGSVFLLDPGPARGLPEHPLATAI